MAPKPEPAAGSSPTTRSQAKRDTEETASGPVAQSSESGGEESWADILRNIYQGQERLSAKIDSHRSDTEGQLEALTSRMSRLELSTQSDSTPSALPASPTRPSDDVRINPSANVQITSPTWPSSTASANATIAAVRPTVELPASLTEFIARMSSDDQNDMRSLLGKYGRKSVSELDIATAAPGDTAVAAAARSPPVTNPPPAGNRSLVCKKEVLGEFDGDPNKLEVFLGRVITITNSNPDPYWEPAVVCCLPQCLVGDAQTWHVGLSTAESKKMTTIVEWCRIMRRRFPVNKHEQRQQAHIRTWDAPNESSMTCFFKKVQLFRHAYGDLFTDDAIAQQVISGLPASMRTVLRLPQEGASLEEVQDALCDWEPAWREDKGIPLATKSTGQKANESATAESESSAKVLTVPPNRPPRSELRSTVVPAKPVVPSFALPTPASVASLAASYDASRIIPANGGQPRMYRRPDSSKVMKLARNCVKCSGQHFDFEHDHLLKAGQLNIIDSLTEDYPEVEESELDLQHF
ncbi:hypothetical protein CF319_g7710 [Tilletia indica]|nr:hypothetical protein CF319_g7710 [Tilletia indica]